MVPTCAPYLKKKNIEKSQKHHTVSVQRICSASQVKELILQFYYDHKNGCKVKGLKSDSHVIHVFRFMS